MAVAMEFVMAALILKGPGGDSVVWFDSGSGSWEAVASLVSWETIALLASGSAIGPYWLFKVNWNYRRLYFNQSKPV